ncbi:MAG: hypothetical protein NXH72_05655 [Hyphomonadaceae bacterium]|nr:hypothetical protein [Hyphomonadaceae bacterium]
MATKLTIPELLQDSIDRMQRLIVPSLPFAASFAVASGVLIWAANVLPEGGSGFAAFSALFFLTLFAHSLFSVAMYHAVLPARSGKLGAAWKLTLAWILVFVIAAIAGSMITLFFALIGASLGVGTSEDVGNISDMTAQMREGGTFWPLFMLFLATLFGLFWFAVRLMTFAAATSARGTVHVLRTWYWTKGYFRVLGPLMLGLVVVPIAALGQLAGVVSGIVFGPEPTPVQAGLSTALAMIILLPSAWLGHGFAASVFARLAPEDTDQTTTPAS